MSYNSHKSFERITVIFYHLLNSMDDTIKKHTPHDIIVELKEGLGNTFETELVSDGLKGMGEITENVQDAIKNSDLKHIEESTQKSIGGFFSKIKEFFGK